MLTSSQCSGQSSPSSSLGPSLGSCPSPLAETSDLMLHSPWTAELTDAGDTLPTSAHIVPRPNEAVGRKKSTSLSGLKTRPRKKLSHRTAAQEDEDLIDGFVQVPSSLALPQSLIDKQMGNDSSSNRSQKLRHCKPKGPPCNRTTSWSLVSSTTLLSNSSAAATADASRRPSLPALDKLMTSSSRKMPSPKWPVGNINTLPTPLPSLEIARVGGSNSNPLISKRLTSPRNTGAPSRRISGAELPRELDSRPTTTCILDLPSIPVQNPPGARAALVSTSTRTTDSAGDVYASADSSLLHFGPAPPLPPGVNVGNSKSDGTASPGLKSRRRLSVPRVASRASIGSASLSSSSIGIDCLAATQPPPPDTRTLASLYMVCGLPKDPQCWTLAQPEALPAHLDGAVPRFWRPEVLGTTISGQDADLLAGEPDKRRASSSRNNSGTTAGRKPHSIPSQSTENGLGKEELARVQAKAMKLAFAREVEVIASTIQPSSTTHCFSFVVPAQTSAVTDATGAIGQQWDLSVAGATGGHTSGRPKTYYGACLQVWSHADRARSEAIRRTVEEGSKAKSAAIARAVKAAAAGKRLGARLERANKSAMGAIPLPEGLASRNWAGYTSTSGETDTDTEGFCSESEWDGPASLLPVANLPGGTPFWLPYCLVLISRIPIYDIMADHLRISWARYHQAIGKHSQQMLKMLNFPCPKPGELMKLPVGGSQQSSSSANFVVKIPGKTNLINGGLEDVDFTMWPVFKSLSLSHLVSIYELALSPMGRVVFFSRYPAMLNMAVETFRVLLELRGWQGLCQSIVHARDVKIYLEDPGPFLLGMNSQLRPIVASGAPPEIMIVDIDTDNIICQKPHPQAFSKGRERLKIIRRLEEVLGTLGGIRGVPSEFHEAFPGGRFRPFSAVEIKDMPSEAERLLPPAEWNWDQTKAVMAFDQILSKVPRRGFAKVFKRKSSRQAAQLDSSAQHVQEIVRKHTAGFVDRRDMLETKIWKLNRRLAFLMAESMEWKQHFDIFQKFANKLSVESQDLKTRLEVERRDHHQLSGLVSEQKQKQAELESRLLETEQAWMAAQVELAKAQDIREELERQKRIMVSEMKSIALGDEDESIVEQIVPRVENRYMPSRASMAMSDHGSLTARNLQRFSVQAESSPHISPRSITGAEDLPTTGIVHSHAGVSPGSTDRGSPLSMGRASPQSLLTKSALDCRRASLIRGFRSPLDELSEFDTDSEATSGLSGMDERARLSRTAVIETMRSIQGRLEAALRTAGQLDEEELKSYDVSGSGRRTHSTLSAESRDSRIIPLQRGRRKPTNKEQDRPRTSSTASPDQVELGAHQAESLGRADSMRPKGVSLLRGTRYGPRMSAISLLKPGSSIFGDRPSSSASVDPTISDYTKLETVIDGNELEEIDEHHSHGPHEQQDQNQRVRDRRGARLRRQASSSSSSGRVATVVDLESRNCPFTPTGSVGEISSDLSPCSGYVRSEHLQHDETEDGASSIASTDHEEAEDEEEEEEKFLSATEEEQEALSELGTRARSTLGRLRKMRGSVSDISRVSMVGMRPPSSVTRHGLKEKNGDDESMAYRKSFMSYDSSSTVRNMHKPSGGGGGSNGSSWR